MKKHYKKSLFIFRRDLRLDDNTGLISAINMSEKVIPCFIFDPRQVEKQNDFRSLSSIQFMMESLDDLEQQLKSKKGKLYRFYGIAEDVISQLLKKEQTEAVFVNRDYTPFSIKRDRQIKKHCSKYGIEFNSFSDILLHEVDTIKTGNQDPYTVFTPYYKKASQVPVRKPEKIKKPNFYLKTIAIPVSKKKYPKPLKYKNPDIHVHGGRSYALKILKSLPKFKDYAKVRDYPGISTTNLSAYIKYGNVSIREVYYAMEKALGKKSTLSRQLYWHDFYTQLAYFSPYVFGQPFRLKYKKLKWSKSTKKFDTWCQGLTGFPIVDAGMRQLNATGFMHNRVRMIVGSFLTKDLHINWLWGEKYFAQLLVDYDPCVNNGNWQWVASTGADAQPYFRIFNPWLQQKKFDPECTYIKKWIPELKDLDSKVIHAWNKVYSAYDVDYPAPIVDHSIQVKIAKTMYRVAAQGA